MNCFNLQRKLFWSGELVLLPERQTPPQKMSPDTAGELCGQDRLMVQTSDSLSFLDTLDPHLHSCLGVSFPPPVTPVAVTGQLPTQPLQKEGPPAAVNTHLVLWAAG